MGQVTDVEEPGDGTTHVRLHVKKTLKGAAPPGNAVTVVIPGGRREGSSLPMIVPGQPKFQKKEKAIVFLREVADHFEVCHGEAGKQPAGGPEAKAMETDIKTIVKKKPLR